jgi:hypothetical protein
MQADIGSQAAPAFNKSLISHSTGRDVTILSELRNLADAKAGIIAQESSGRLNVLDSKHLLISGA